MSEFLSSGLNGEVYKSTPHDQKLFPQADLVKVGYYLTREESLQDWYSHKIAEILVPEHTARYIAITDDPTANINNDQIKKIHDLSHRTVPAKIYGKLITTHPGHSLFSTHSKNVVVLPETGTLWKDLDCEDEQCIDHQRLHLTNELWKNKVEQAISIYKQFGITVDPLDLTDWCMDQQDQIVFFEIESIDREQLLRYLQSRRHPTQQERRAYQLLLRYEEHYYKYRVSAKPKRDIELRFKVNDWLKVQRSNILPWRR